MFFSCSFILSGWKPGINPVKQITCPEKISREFISCQVWEYMTGKIVWSYELLCPLEGPGSLPDGNPRKRGEITKFLSRSDPKVGKITPKKGKNYSENTIFVIFLYFFPIFGGSDQGGEFSNFSPCFGEFLPEAFRGPLRRKNSSQVWSLFGNKFWQGWYPCHQNYV